ncbi:TPA: hypothetical protein N0F65_010456 [Lagenidium giganteum]|uniref:Nitroreductase domain-containing protein n=1 Tax=Lagenidium giganteum TaxID=4803 RepID=A0AAV2YM45_9STRA|nr:TPA: hypothetical protein N0F65_010456 [Lagenidium giganteum]
MVSSSPSSSTATSTAALVTYAVTSNLACLLAATLLQKKAARRPPFEYTQGERSPAPQEEESFHEYEHAVFQYQRIPEHEMKRRAYDFYTFLNMRRSVRFYSPEDVPMDVLLNCVRAAGTAPSGAHTQPWHFCIVKRDDLKHQIRLAVEKEEQLNYERRMNKVWAEKCHSLVAGLPKPWVKPYLTDAPHMIVMMKVSYDLDTHGNRKEVYYPEQSCGIAAGLLITALHNANLVTLTSTPMGAESAIRDILGRPKNEKVYLLLPIGFAAKDATVPYRDENNLRKPIEKICSIH